MNAQKIILSLAAGFLACTAVLAQEPVPTNRYAMKLEKKADGTYALQREARYAKILNPSEIPDLYVPYVHQNQRLSGKLYNKVETEGWITFLCDECNAKREEKYANRLNQQENVEQKS